MSRVAKKKLRKVSCVRPNRVLQEKVREWLERNKDGMQRLAEAKINTGSVASLVSERGLDERAMSIILDKLERVTGIDIKQCLLSGAKRNLWEEEDRLPEITTYDEMLARLECLYQEFEPKRELAKEIGVCESWVITTWIKNRTSIKTSVLERVLKLMLRLDHPEEYERLYPAGQIEEDFKSQVSKKSDDPSNKTVRLAVDGFFSYLTMQLNLLRQLRSDTGYEPVQGDHAKALLAVQNLLRTFGVNEEAVAALGEHVPLTSQELSLLGGVFGQPASKLSLKVERKKK